MSQLRYTNEPVHEISNNVLCATSKASSSACAYAQTDQSLCLSLEYSMNVKLLTEQYLEFLSLKGGYTGSSESTSQNTTLTEITCHSSDIQMSQCMRFPTTCYVRLAKPQLSLRIRAVWSEPLLVAWVFFDC